MANYKSTQHKNWGGSWTEEKLDCFEKYVKAYLTIMNKYRDKYNWELFYFDGFAGCGDRKLEEEKSKMESLFGEKITAEELSVYQGAAERVVQIEKVMRGFDYYYFIDKDEANLTRLDMKLSTYETTGQKVYRPSDANAEIKNLADHLSKPKYATPHQKIGKALCLLDPFGMSVKWKSIQAIAGPGVDLWILVPTGSIVNRLIKNNGKLRYPEKLEEFFGLQREVIQERFFEKQVMPADLFDADREEVRKVKNIIGEIAKLYCEQLGSLFKFVTNEPLVMRNSRGLPIFHFVCASNNKAAVGIAQDIISKKQKR